MSDAGDAAARILVVDDEPFNVDLLEQELEAHGYETLAASSGEEALALAREAAPDLVLLDVMMPGMDGMEACRRLGSDPVTADLPVIFATALTDVEHKVEAFEAGGVDYVTKPFRIEEVLARVGTHVALARARAELVRQNERLRVEIEAHRRARGTIECLEAEIRDGREAEEIVGASPAIASLLAGIGRVAATDSTVLVLGETGTGKELVARAVHRGSSRASRPLVVVNCAALPRDLVESELFGHERGAFTGATERRRGRFELADGGTLLLDEVGELPPEAQAKLLRVLQEQEFERIGATETLSVDVRVIAATNRDLEGAVAAGRFRADLFYRLNVFPLTVPPLRERREDIPLLVEHLLEQAARRLGRAFDGAAPSFLDEAARHPWPGNVRELENAVERGAILSPGPLLEGGVPPAVTPGSPSATPGAPSPAPLRTLEDLERSHIGEVLATTGWVVEGPGGAARVLGLNPSTLRGRMRKLGIRKSG